MTDSRRESHVSDTLGRGIFTSGGEVFTLRQVLGAAECYGLADGLWGWLEDALACESYAAEEGYQSDAEQLQAALDDFRYLHRLLSAEETERWLAERRLSEEELIDTLDREGWLRRFQGELSSIRRSYPPSAEEAAGALWPALFVPDRLGPMAVALARRVVAPRMTGQARQKDELPALQAAQASGAAPAGPRGCPAWGRCSPEWRLRLQSLEDVYQSLLESLLSARALEAALLPRRLDLTRFRLLAARFSSRDAAREALLCLREDGESFQEATSRAGARREDRELFLEEAPEAISAFMVSAVAGESFLQEEEPLLFQVERRSPPRLEDPAVRERLESALLERSFGPAIEEQVRWLIPLG